MSMLTYWATLTAFRKLWKTHDSEEEALQYANDFDMTGGETCFIIGYTADDIVVSFYDQNGIQYQSNIGKHFTDL